jgi:transcriptional regulator with XRE-family HTH domain
VTENRPGMPAMIGPRVREYRTKQGMSLDDLARATGLSKSFLSRAERGERRLDRRTQLDALADALGVSVANLTGQPYSPGKQRDAKAHAAVPGVRVALMDTEYGQRPELPEVESVRPIAVLEREVWRVERLCEESDYVAFGDLLPALLLELHAAAADPVGEVRAAAARLLTRACQSAFYLLKDLGYHDLAWIAADRASEAAGASELPELLGLSMFLRSHALRAVGARHRALATARRAADALQGDADDGPVGEVYGMLHLTSALSSIANGRTDEATAHLDEASEIASRTGDGNAYGLHFGPTNVGIWRVAIAVEAGEGGKVMELARDVAIDKMPSRGRRAAFWSDVGRGLAREPGRHTEAQGILRRAESLAPLQVRANPYVRETVADLRNRYGGRELREMARRMGLA